MIYFIILFPGYNRNLINNYNYCTVKLVYNDQPWDPKVVAVVDRWSLFKGFFVLLKLKTGTHHISYYRQVVAIQRWLYHRFDCTLIYLNAFLISVKVIRQVNHILSYIFKNCWWNLSSFTTKWILWDWLQYKKMQSTSSDKKESKKSETCKFLIWHFFLLTNNFHFLYKIFSVSRISLVFFTKLKIFKWIFNIVHFLFSTISCKKRIWLFFACFIRKFCSLGSSKPSFLALLINMSITFSYSSLTCSCIRSNVSAISFYYVLVVVVKVDKFIF
jgi:hypothetical protein